MNAFCGDLAEELNHYAIPKLSCNAILDYLSCGGVTLLGEKGESIPNGGLNNFFALTGIANASKTLVLSHFIMTALVRYFEYVDGHLNDTENTLEFTRIINFIRQICINENIDFDSVIKPMIVKKFPLIPGSVLNGTAWEKNIKAMVDTRSKFKQKDKLKTPILDHMGENIWMAPPHLAFIDSFTNFTQDVAEAAQDKGVAGGKERNMEFVSDQKGKFQLVRELQNILPRGDIYLTTSAHLADNLQLDPNAEKKAKLEVLGRDNKLRGCPSNFYAYPWLFLFIYSTKSLLGDDKLPLYPEAGVDKDMKKDGELSVLDTYTCRSKVGQTKINFPLIISQSLGVLPGLTNFHYIKDYCGYFGITGNGTETNRQNYHLDILPDVALSRTTIRRKIDETPALVRALEITAQLYIIQRYWKSFDQSLICTPKELYEDIKKLGYNWDELLNGTRGWWHFDQYTHPLKFLSTVDLLKMRAGIYRPFWMKDA